MANLPMPLPVARALAKLAEDLSRARRRRRLSQASLAERSGVSIATVRRMERGDLAAVSVGHLARVIYVLGEIERLDGLLDTRYDEIGLMLMDEQLPKRVRSRRCSGAL